MGKLILSAGLMLAFGAVLGWQIINATVGRLGAGYATSTSFQLATPPENRAQRHD